MTGGLTPEQVHDLVNAVLASVDDRTYSLEEVAERTGFALTELQSDCKKGLIEHTWRGRQRRMTPRQVSKLIAQHRYGGEQAAQKPVAATDRNVDGLAAVRAATLKSAARRATPRRRGAA